MSTRLQDKKLEEAYLAKVDLIRKGAAANVFETAKEREERISKLKKDYKACTEYYFPEYCTAPIPDFHIDLAKKSMRNPRGKFLVRWGRGLAKSVVCNVTMAFWLMINKELNYLVLIGQNHNKAKELLGDLQAELEGNPRIIHDYGEQVGGVWELGNFKTRMGFRAKALGIGQSPRGLREKAQRPDGICIDDVDTKEMSRNDERIDNMADWVTDELLPTMDGPKRRVWVANNRFAEKTIQSTLEDRAKGRKNSWKVHRVDACGPAPLRKPRWKGKYADDYYQELDEEMGSLSVDSEYNNTPYREGKHFKSDMINWLSPQLFPRIDHQWFVVGHWDIAYSESKTADTNAVRVWGIWNNKYYLNGTYCAQSKMRKALEWMSDYQKRVGDGKVFWQYESQFWNEEVQNTIAAVEEETGVRLNLYKVDTPKSPNKFMRIMSTLGIYQNGKICMPIRDKGDNMTTVANQQVFDIEPGYHTKDDAPDADEHCFRRLAPFTKRASKGGKALFGGRRKSQMTW